MNNKHSHLQGWEEYSYSNTYTNQLKFLSESLNQVNTVPTHITHINSKLHQSVSPKKNRILQSYIKNSVVIDKGYILSQKQHYLQGKFIKKAQFLPKIQLKHNYIGPILQQIKIYQKNKNIIKNDSIIKQITR
ncbi:unnamed protein product [Paramecium primaurelia]|uniref:Uncharacterized protein n=1 Tax=Paramecium primaurelia TaxID=5886 RepID=A0A8S1PZE2_PARPR|nr:unnamed protein product [Paramecium primaurelia]